MGLLVTGLSLIGVIIGYADNTHALLLPFTRQTRCDLALRAKASAVVGNKTNNFKSARF